MDAPKNPKTQAWWQLQRTSQNTRVQNVAKITQRVQTCLDISRRTVALIQEMPKSAMSVARCTCQCLPFPCTFWLITLVIAVMFAEKPFRGHGYCKAIWGHIQDISLIHARYARNHLLTGPIYEHICKRILLQRISNARDVTRPLPWSLISISIMNLPV